LECDKACDLPNLDIFALDSGPSASSHSYFFEMVGRALSERVKKGKRRRADNAHMQEAVDAFLRNQELPDGKHESDRALARRFDVSNNTLCRHANGGVSMSAFNTSKQKVTPPEERVLVDHICVSSDRGFPMSHKSIVAHANSIIIPRGGETIDPESNWVDRFLQRHYAELQTHWS
jgi:hypothetical protein